MKVSVRFFAVLKEIVGKREENLNFNEQKVTVGMALKVLGKQYGKAFSEYVFDAKTGGVKSFLQLLVNGSSLPSDELKAELHEGDILAILPPVGGG